MRKSGLFLLLLFIFFSVFAVGQNHNVVVDTIPIYKPLQEVVVLASRLSQTQLPAPVSISKLSYSQIRRQAIPRFSTLLVV